MLISKKGLSLRAEVVTTSTANPVSLDVVALNTHGSAFREIPLASFIEFRDGTEAKSPPPIQPEVSYEVSLKKRDEAFNGEYHSKSLGPSKFIRTVRNAFQPSSVHHNWKLAGKDSLVAVHLAASSAIKNEEGSGLFQQVWMERPKQGLGVCKFEIAGRLKGRDIEDSDGIRQGIGPKTVDYFKILVGISTSAIDRHLFDFLRLAGLAPCGYVDAQSIIHATADLLGVDRARFDHSIWQFMSKRAASPQLSECHGHAAQKTLKPVL